jgi:pimeloyl-ACP methyl ester carboxylesterase
MALIPETWKHKIILNNEINFHYITQGEGDLVLLLHGFPQNHYAWRYQMAPLAKKFKIVAPDLRGYHLTEKKEPYHILTLCTDIAELIKHLGYEKAHIVGHDWGAIILWSFAHEYPDLCDKIISLNVPYFPHGDKPLHKMLLQPEFDYMRAFQIPVLPEKNIEKDIDGFIKQVLIDYAAQKNHINDDELLFFANSFRGVEKITPAINYYRNLTKNWELTAHHANKKIFIPALLIVADRDPLLTPEMSLHIKKYVPNIIVKHIDCGHWTQQEAPNETNQIILDFLLTETKRPVFKAVLMQMC